MRVLIVEDEAKLAALLRRGLVEEAHAADVARSGEDALWMARATEYDAIVLDLMLPGVDGVEVCRRLRADGVWSPVLMLTARDALEDRVGGLDAGADDYLTKPFAFAELLARLRALVRRGAGERPARARGRRPPPRPGHAARLARRRPRSRCRGRSSRSWRPSCAGRAACSRASICSSTRGTTSTSTARTSTDVYVRYLREKIDRPFGRDVDRDRARRGLPAAGGRGR